MNKNQLVFTLAILSTGIMVATSQVQAQVPVYEKLQKNIQHSKFPEEIKIFSGFAAMNNVDLAAKSINFSVVRADDESNGLVKISGIISNVGKSTYISNPNQQTVQLYEQIPGGTSKLVASKPFGSLSIGKTISVVYTRTWRKSDEFPPTYTLIISFDPDIYIDGNNNNDDSNTANNKLSKSGEAINALPFIRR